MIPTLLGMAAPSGQAGRLSILIFHRVLAAPDPLFPDEIDAERFDRICGLLRRWFNVLPLDGACRALRAGHLPERALAITFDDGYADNHELALPILQRHGLTATFFIATGFLDGGRMWNDTVIEAVRRTSMRAINLGAIGLEGIGTLPLHDASSKRAAIDRILGACKYLPIDDRESLSRAVAKAMATALPDDLMMTSQQVVALHQAGMGIGGHTVNHPILTRLQPTAARAEMLGGKLALESLIQAPVLTFAYPNGRPQQDYVHEHVELAREIGFEFAVSTAIGAARQSTDPFQLPRFTPWDRAAWAFALRLVRNMHTAETTFA